jgi:uncharacterized protein DUF5985
MAYLAPSVYLLCLISSAVCAWLLARRYARSQTRLLLWAALCFGLLALNNLLVVLDLLVITSVDLSLARLFASLVGILILLYGFIWELD